MASRKFIFAIGRAEVCTRPSYSCDLQMALGQDLLLLHAAFVIEYRESYSMHVGQKKGAYHELFRIWSYSEEPSPFLRWIIIAVSTLCSDISCLYSNILGPFTSHGANCKASRFVGSSNFTVPISSHSESESIHDRLYSKSTVSGTQMQTAMFLV